MIKTATCPRTRSNGFTLIELLIVIVIMAILATMFVPVINKAIQNADNNKSAAFVQEVRSACDRFKDANNGMYPGQDDLGQLKGTTPDAGPYTGSQMLASRLFGYPHTDIPSNTPKAKSLYLEYKLHLLLDRSSKGTAIAKNSLGDNSATPNALLYFPSRLREKLPTRCYRWADSSQYVTTAGAQTVFNNECITDKRLAVGKNARNPGGILIIGTGANDMYLESDDNDDIRSWDAD